MSDQPILFKAPMVRALLEGRKTQTRRLSKRGVSRSINHGIGDRLWVRETWQGLTFGDFRPTKHEPCEVRYAATDPCADLDAEARGYPWRPSIFMPRWASRLTLIVTDVRVERLQEISPEDAIAEGLIQMTHAPASAKDMGCDWGFEGDSRHGSPVSAYAALWNHINGLGAWAKNPWVAAYTFIVHLENINAFERNALAEVRA